MRKIRNRTPTGDTTLLALLWALPHRTPKGAEAAVRARLRSGRSRLCGLLRDHQNGLL